MMSVDLLATIFMALVIAAIGAKLASWLCLGIAIAWFALSRRSVEDPELDRLLLRDEAESG